MSAAALHTDIAAALDWWRLAGVDHDYAEAKGWLRPAEAASEPPAAGAVAESLSPPATPPAAARPAAPPPAQLAKLGGAAAQWPGELGSFRAWWRAEPTLGPAPTERVASRGEAGAALLVLVPQPEAGDAAAGHLLAGEQGALVGAMLRAMGLADNAALAALLPRHTPIADWEGLAGAGLGELALHHLALHRPARVLVLGQGILSHLGLDPAQKTALLPLAGEKQPGVPVMAAPAAEVLLARPAARAALWRNWLEWTKE